MKKLCVLIWISIGFVMCAYGQRYYEIRQDSSGRKLLYIHDKKFIGTREDIMKLDTFGVTQPSHTELLMLPLTGIDPKDIWVYQLFRFIDNQ